MYPSVYFPIGHVFVFPRMKANIRVVGTSGPAGIKAGSGISNPVSGSHFSLPEMKQELAGIRNSEL